MANRENTILLKRSDVIGKVPLPGDIQLGELALNVADVKLYTSGTTDNDIIQIGWDRISRTGDTVTGDFNFIGDFSATTISATTYNNLPISGLTEGNNISLINNNGNYTISVTGVTGGGGDYLPLSGGTVTGDTIFTSGLTINETLFNTGYTPTFTTGLLSWNGGDTLNIGLINNHIHRVGQEVLFYGKAQGTISKGDAIMFAGTQGDHILFTKAVPSVINNNPEYFMGVAPEPLSNNDWGYVTHFGYINQLNTLSYSAGTILYYDSTTGTGLLTPTEPNAPNAKIIVAAVVRSHNNQGVILVRPDISHKLQDVQDVLISGVTNGDFLKYDNGVWKNVPTALSESGNTITFTATTIYNSPTSPATGNISGDTTNALTGIVQKIYHNDSVVPTFPSGWVKIDGEYATSIENIIFAEWISGSRVEYWIVNDAPSGFVPETRTLTINGTTQDLSANRTYTIPTVINVGTTSVTSGTDGRVFFQAGGVIQQDGAFFWDNTNKRLGVGATPDSTVRLDVRAQGALSTDIAFRVRNSANSSNFLSVNGNGNIIVGSSTPSGSSSKLQVFSGFVGGNQLELICDTSNFNVYHGISFISTGRPGFFSLQSQGTQDTFNRVRFTSGGNEANAKISAYIYQTNTDRQGHWHFRTQVHLGNADRTYNNNYGLQTLVVENATAPTATPTDGFVQYSADITAGNAAPHFRTENGSIVKLYQETTAITGATLVGGGGTTITDTDTFGGYTLQQIAQALKNLGILQ